MENQITEFLVNYQIPNRYIWYYIKDSNGKKTPLGEMNNIKDVSQIKTIINPKIRPTYYIVKNKKGEKKEVKLSKTEYDSLKLAVSIYLKHSPENIYCIDIDEVKINKNINELIKLHPEFEIFRNTPYLEGNTKGIHIYCKILNVPSNAKELNVFKNVDGDLIRKNNNMWEMASKKWIGKPQLMTFDFNEIKDIFNSRIFGVEDKDLSEVEIKKEKTRKQKIEKIQLTNYIDANITETDIKLVKLINVDKDFKDYDKWIKLCWGMKSAGYPFELFHDLSKTGEKYSGEADCLKYWNSTKISKIDKGYIRSFAKKANPKKFFEIMLDCDADYFIDDEVKPRTDIKKFCQRYLLQDESIKKINDKNDFFQNEIINFFESDKLKTLSLRSPYGTGKTQLIKKLIDTFEPKKILWLSYRKTLTNNIIGGENFGEEYGFKNYQDGALDADRLIIQLESILKLSCQMDFIDDDTVEYPNYDLVIVDEVESILAQFNSPTFKGMSKECFEFVQNIIINSKKMIVLDGDINDRTYRFIDTFGNSIKLVNDIKINQRHFVVTRDEFLYLKKIEKDLNNDLNVVIVSMSSNKCEFFKSYFEEKIPKLRVLIYTGSSGDDTREDFKNVDEIWSGCQLLIYSPTCEAGVNFDLPHFNKMYGFLVEQSTTQRGLCQMFARIRQLTDPNILLLTRLEYNEHLTENCLYNFDEVEKSIKLLEGIKMKTEDVLINGKMCKSTKLSAYDVNYIYNKVESLNSLKFFFLFQLKNICEAKGHTFEVLNDGNGYENISKLKIEDVEEYGYDNKDKMKEGLTQYIDIEKDLYKYDKIEHVIKSKDIKEEEYEELQKKQNKDDATQEEKLQIAKHYLKKSLGVDTIDSSFPNLQGDKKEKKEAKIESEGKNKLNFDSVKKFVHLIDAKNIKESTDNQTKETNDKVKLLTGLIEGLGFANVFDNKKVVYTEFEAGIKKLMKNSELFTDTKNTKIRFGLTKNTDLETTKGFLGFVNTVLNPYCVAVEYCRKTMKEAEIKKLNVEADKENKVRHYQLRILYDVNELLEYKIMRGFKFIDEKAIRPVCDLKKSTTYAKYVDMDKLNKINNERLNKLSTLKAYETENPLDYGVLDV